MPFLTKDDLKTHLYQEIIDEITRNDNNIVDRCINTGISEVKSFISRYDLPVLFDLNNGLNDDIKEHLKNLVKDVASWHLVRLANPNVDLKLFRTAYEDAIAFLTKIQKGQADPEGWPYKPDNSVTPGNENYGVQWSSNRKRKQHF